MSTGAGAGLTVSAGLHVEVRGDVPGGSRGAGRVVEALCASTAEAFPASVQLAVVDRSGTVMRTWSGMSSTTGTAVPALRGTSYDLASLTKVVATTTVALRLRDEGSWRLHDPVARWLHGFGRDDITLEHLLTHTSGLIPHRPYFESARGLLAIRRAVYADVAASDGPGGVAYSDLNFMLLGWGASACAGRPFDRLVRDVVTEPLGMSRTRFRPPTGERLLTAATEDSGDQRRTEELVWGEVHDGNAHALGGVAGHAGLFAPCDDLVRFVAALLHPTRHPVLSAASVAEMSRYQAGEQPDVRGLGWRLAPLDWGDWPESTYWHTGFTGTSLLVSPASGVAVVLLANAVHPSRQLERQASWRARLHRAVAEWLS
ncbi:MAG: serine hydrolase domain-containing protein [Acidimicrobiales bacterium]